MKLEVGVGISQLKYPTSDPSAFHISCHIKKSHKVNLLFEFCDKLTQETMFSYHVVK